MLLIRSKKGFSIIEVMVSATIVSLLTVSIFTLINYTLKIAADNKFRVAATNIANQRIEQIRNLPYSEVGTQGGMVPGVLEGEITIANNNGTFRVDTFINYFDDPFDGTVSGTPADTAPYDYKVARVRAYWSGPFGEKYVSLFTNVAPKGIETNIGGGTLSIQVIDANGLPVSNASVDIVNNKVTPAIAPPTAFTDANGMLNYYGATTSVEGYEITVSKAGYSLDRTYTRDEIIGGVINANPTKPHATVLEGVKTDISFAIDLLSTLNIETVGANMPDNWTVKNDTSGEPQTNSRLAFDAAGFVYVIWQDHCCSADSKIHVQKYDDAGNPQWTERVIGTANDSIIPDILTDQAGNLYLAFGKDKVGDKKVSIFSLNSSDGTDRWEDHPISTPWNSDQLTPRIALLEASGQATTSMVWVDDWHGDYDIFMQNYDDSGNPLFTLNEYKRVSNAATGTNQYSPEMAAYKDELTYVVWSDDRNTDLDIYMAKIASTGEQMWSPNNQRTNTDGGTADQYDPDVAVDQFGYIYIVWTDERNGQRDIYMQKYNSAGSAQWAADLGVSTNTDEQYSPNITINSINEIYVVWTDEKNGNQDIYSQKLDLSGTKLWSSDIRVNMNLDNSNQWNPAITFNPVNNKPFASWESDENGDVDIFTSGFDSYGTETPLNNVPLNIVCAKQVGDNPVIYKYSNNFLSSSGAVNLNNIEWDSYTITVDPSYSAMTLVLVDPVIPIGLDPNTTRTVKFYFE